jgi:glycosyltransferase involved in cell wall biosynthesis
MHVLFVHQNYPAQFGHVAAYLAQQRSYRCTFVSERPAVKVGNVELIQYQTKGGAIPQTHYCSRTFENAIWHTHAVYKALRGRPDIQPDLVVGHSGFGSTLFLRELYRCPIINYFEFFYRPRNSDMDFRPDFPTHEMSRLRALARNAMILLDLDNCDLGYAPTRWQLELMPKTYQSKLRAIFDGIDTVVWRPQTGLPRQVGDRTIPPEMRLVTYVSRGMESMRGFDIFLKIAKKLADRRRDVLFVVVGEDRVCYGGDEEVTGSKSFKEWALMQDDYDLSRFVFTGQLPPALLANLLALTDLHIYLTVPFVLSWSMMNALACGATVLASSTEPVREMIEHCHNGLLADFFDVEGLVEQANQVLEAPGDFKPLGAAAVELIRDRYSLDVCLPKMLELYQEGIEGFRSSAAKDR